MTVTTKERQMNDIKKRSLLAWCENDNCGEPIYAGDKHIEEVSDAGNRYFYCSDCIVKEHTPDENLAGQEN
jgi:hypothetical protein